MKKYTHKRTTVKDIAREAGVSTSLVSFVMCNEFSGGNYRVHPDTSKRVLEIAKSLNYHPNISAKSLKTGRFNTIGVILSDISNAFFSEIARIIENEATKLNYSVLFGSTDEDPVRLNHLVDVFQNKGVDGIIVVPCSGIRPGEGSLMKCSIPVVLIDRNIEGSGFPVILLDNEAASYSLTGSLLDRGIGKVEMISYSLSVSNIRGREDGYVRCMNDRGLESEINVHRVDFHNSREDVVRFIEDARCRGVQGLLFATNMLAVCGMSVISGMGFSIPQDFSIACFDRNDAFDVFPSDIIYARQPLDLFARESMSILMRMINGQYPPESEKTKYLQHEIVGV